MSSSPEQMPLLTSQTPPEPPALLLESAGFLTSDGSPACLRLTSASLSPVSPQGKAHGTPIQLADIVSVTYTTEGVASPSLTVLSWPLTSSSTGVRARSQAVFRAAGGGGSEGLLAAWALALRRVSGAEGAAGLAGSGSLLGDAAVQVLGGVELRGPLVGVLGSSGSPAAPPTLPPRHLLCYINPVAGSGRGVAMVAQVQPLLLDAGFQLHTVLLTARGQPTAALAAMPASELLAFEGIVAVGGDGSLSEVVEGIMARRDWAEVLARLRLGLLPSGSGNGLAISLAVASRHTHSAFTSAMAMAKGGSCPVDLASTFVLWGQEGEGGGSSSSSSSSSSNSSSSGSGGAAEEGGGGGGKQLNPLWAPPSAPQQLRRDGLWGQRRYCFLSLEWAIVADIDIESESLRYLGHLRFDVYGLYRCLFLRRYKGRFSYLPPHTQQDTAAAAASSSALSGASLQVEGESAYSEQPRLQHLVPFDQPPPPTWRAIEGVFTLLWAVNSSHQSAGVSVSSTARHSDGQWTVVLMRDRGVCGITGAMLALDMEGSVTGVSGVESFACLAWRLEPEVGGEVGVRPGAGAGQRPAHTGPGNVCLDGEGVTYGPVQGEVHPGLLNVYSLSRAGGAGAGGKA